MPRDPISDLRRYAHTLQQEADPGEAHRAARLAAVPAQAPARSWRRRLATVTAAAAVLAGGNVGLALAADSAVPGDPLYGVDRAYERVAEVLGIGGDNARERLEEASTLATRGDVPRALSTARETLSSLPVEAGGLAQALAALQAAESDASETGAPESAPGRELTAELHVQTELLLGLARQVVAAAHGDDPGAVQEAASQMSGQAQRVAEAARQIREARAGQGPPDVTPPPPGPGDELPPPSVPTTIDRPIGGRP